MPQAKPSTGTEPKMWGFYTLAQHKLIARALTFQLIHQGKHDAELRELAATARYVIQAIERKEQPNAHPSNPPA